MFFIIIILSAVVQGLMALFVLLKNNKNLTNILFFLLSLSLMIWAGINFVITNDPYSSTQLILYRFLMFSVVVQNTFFFFFAHTYPNRELAVRPRRVKLYLLLSALAAAATLSPILFTGVEYGSAGARPVTGPGMLLFVLHAAVSVGTGMHTMHKRFATAHGLRRQQLRLIFIGSVILWGIVPLTNFIISLATKTLFFARISPIYTLAFSSVIAYAIVAQKLFDIRAAVARSVAYVLLIGTIALIYSISIFGGLNVVFDGHERETLRQLLSIALVFPLVVTFQPLKRWIDRLTNKIFYRDSYDTQEVLDRLGNLLVAEIDLGRVIHGSRSVLEDALKSSFIEFILFRGDKVTFESEKSGTVQENIEELASHIRNQHKDLLVTDELPEQSPFHRAFSEDDVAVSLRLKTQKQVVGYILFGEKRSGDIYTTQDRKLLTIVASELAIAVQNALRFEEIEKFNLTLQDKIAEATRQLRQTNEKLKALDETKDEFISMASHQLRTPLTSVKGYLSMVIEGDAGKITGPQRKLLTQAFISSQRMVYLIADLLNVSRLKTGKFIIEAVPCNLAEVVSGEIDQLVETAAGRHLELTYEKPHSFPELMLDETKIRQVIMNFVDNAIYYTPSGGHIQVSLTETPGAVEFRVTDDGIGIPKHEQHHLFGKFYRAGNAKKARPDGTGLGLFMAKKVIVAQGGSILFSSQEGKGSTFGFTFPKAKLTNNLPPKT